jgi:NADH dehydrogenase
LDFAQHDALVESLRGADVLFNTYWVRFNHQRFTHQGAVENTLKLFEAAREAGVRRVVHVSITNPSLDSPFEYFRGKAQLEEALKASGLSHAILRPAVLFGGDDILINNIAWMLRRFPVFGVFGAGDYRLQPIHVDDFAALAVEEAGGTSNTSVDAVGPESFRYRELVELIGRCVGRPRPMLSIPPWLGLAVAEVVGKAVGDVLLTREEIGGLMAGLLHVEGAAARGTTRLSAWAEAHGAALGPRYASELARRR